MNEATTIRVALYVLHAPGHEPHRMTLCEYCWEDTAAYYEMLRWPFTRDRDATATEAQDHVCLD